MKLNKSAQSMIDYIVITCFVILAIIVGGPFFKNSIQGSFKMQEDTVIDSFSEEIVQASPLDLDLNCVCTDYAATACGAGDCSKNQMQYARVCKAGSISCAGIMTETTCENNNGCCDDAKRVRCGTVLPSNCTVRAAIDKAEFEDVSEAGNVIGTCGTTRDCQIGERLLSRTCGSETFVACDAMGSQGCLPACGPALQDGGASCGANLHLPRRDLIEEVAYRRANGATHTLETTTTEQTLPVPYTAANNQLDTGGILINWRYGFDDAMCAEEISAGRHCFGKCISNFRPAWVPLDPNDASKVAPAFCSKHIGKANCVFQNRPTRLGGACGPHLCTSEIQTAKAGYNKPELTKLTFVTDYGSRYVGTYNGDNIVYGAACIDYNRKVSEYQTHNSAIFFYNDLPCAAGDRQVAIEGVTQFCYRVNASKLVSDTDVALDPELQVANFCPHFTQGLFSVVARKLDGKAAPDSTIQHDYRHCRPVTRTLVKVENGTLQMLKTLTGTEYKDFTGGAAILNAPSRLLTVRVVVDVGSTAPGQTTWVNLQDESTGRCYMAHLIPKPGDGIIKKDNRVSLQQGGSPPDTEPNPCWISFPSTVSKAIFYATLDLDS